jgi:dTDP-4-dehydrorhamnose 3,5-epimerase
MRFTEVAVSGARVIDPEPRGDERGFFARLWCQDEFRRAGLTAEFRQCNSSFSVHRGTLRGLHYQAAPFEEVKLVRCVRGAVFDVVVDVRQGSPTFGRWFGIELTADNRRMLYVPGGCAHGYLTMEDGSEVEYPVSEPYHPEAERGIRWNDPAFRVEWPDVGTLTMSDKDKAWPDFTALKQ